LRINVLTFIQYGHLGGRTEMTNAPPSRGVGGRLGASGHAATMHTSCTPALFALPRFSCVCSGIPLTSLAHFPAPLPACWPTLRAHAPHPFFVLESCLRMVVERAAAGSPRPRRCHLCWSVGFSSRLVRCMGSPVSVRCKPCHLLSACCACARYPGARCTCIRCGKSRGPAPLGYNSI
jgi:hypothetical protein